MTKFKMNINQLQNESKTLINNFDELKESQISLNNIAAKSETAWNDNNSGPIRKRIYDDMTNVTNLCNSSVNYGTEIINLTNELSSVLEANDIKDSQKNIAFDSDYCQSSIKEINEAKTILKNAKRSIDHSDTDCSASSEIRDIYRSMTKNILTLEDIKSKMTNIMNGIDDELNNAKSRMNSIETIYLEDNQLSYNAEIGSQVVDNKEVFSKVLATNYQDSNAELSSDTQAITQPLFNETYNYQSKDLNANPQVSRVSDIATEVIESKTIEKKKEDKDKTDDKPKVDSQSVASNQMNINTENSTIAQNPNSEAINLGNKINISTSSNTTSTKSNKVSSSNIHVNTNNNNIQQPTAAKLNSAAIKQPEVETKINSANLNIEEDKIKESSSINVNIK